MVSLIGVLTADEYYRRMRQGSVLNQLYQIGQFFWTPSLFLLDESNSYLVRSTYNEALGDYEYRIERTSLREEFETRQEPDRTLRIRSDERALIVGSKRRPVILISRPVEGWRDSNRRSDDCFLVAPVYSFGGDETRVSYSQEFIERVKGYVYWQLFYLQASSDGRLREGFVRLDRIQAVHKNLLQQMPWVLEDDVQVLMRHWTQVYLGEELDAVDDLLYEYREAAITDLRAKGLM